MNLQVRADLLVKGKNVGITYSLYMSSRREGEEKEEI